MLALVYSGWCTVLFFTQRKFVFPGAYNAHSAPVGADSARIDVDGVPVWASGVRIDGLTPTTVRGVAIVFHGNDDVAQNAARSYDESIVFAQAGWAVLAPEFPGYAGVPGEPSEAVIAEQGARVARWAMKRVQINMKTPPPLVYIGYSLGGGAACSTALIQRPSGLVLRNTFTSIADFSWRFGVPPVLVRDRFDNRAVLKQFWQPVFLAHGRQDQIVPVAHGRELAKLIKHATYVELDGDHFRYNDEDGYRSALRSWVRANFPSTDFAVQPVEPPVATPQMPPDPASLSEPAPAGSSR